MRSSHKLTSKVAPVAVATCPPSDVVKGAGSLVLPFIVDTNVLTGHSNLTIKKKNSSCSLSVA